MSRIKIRRRKRRVGLARALAGDFILLIVTHREAILSICDTVLRI